MKPPLGVAAAAGPPQASTTHRIRLNGCGEPAHYEGYSPVSAMIPYAGGVLTAFSNAAQNQNLYRVHWSPDGKNLGAGPIRYEGFSRITAMIPYKDGVLTAFANAGGANNYRVHWSPDGNDLGSGAIRYEGHSAVIAMMPYAGGVLTAFGNAGGSSNYRVHWSPDGNNLGSGSARYDGTSPITAMIPYNNGVLTAFSSVAGNAGLHRVHWSPNGDHLGSGPPRYEGCSPVTAMIPYNGGVLSAFSNAGCVQNLNRVHWSRDGQNLGGGPVRYEGKANVAAMSVRSNGVLVALNNDKPADAPYCGGRLSIGKCRPCESGCAELDLLCHTRKAECELLKESQILAGKPYELAIRDAMNNASGEQKIPANIRARLAAYFPSEILDAVRWTYSTGPLISVQNSAIEWRDRNGVTLGNIIVFKQDKADDIGLWAHELEHVVQYQQLGIDGFAQAYTYEAGEIEGWAEDKAAFAMQGCLGWEATAAPLSQARPESGAAAAMASYHDYTLHSGGNNPACRPRAVVKNDTGNYTAVCGPRRVVISCGNCDIHHGSIANPNTMLACEGTPVTEVRGTHEFILGVNESLCVRDDKDGKADVRVYE